MFVRENLERDFYSSYSQQLLLGVIHSVMKVGIILPFKSASSKNSGLPLTDEYERTVLKFLGYSNSQLKKISCWFMIQGDMDKNDTQIMAEMGDFTKEPKMLKRFARRG